MFDIRQIWKKTDLLVFTTNGVVKADGSLVMGKGIAKLVRDEYKEFNLNKTLGEAVSKRGNEPFLVVEPPFINKPVYLLSFPTKNHWRDKSDLDIIKRSRFIAEGKLRRFMKTHEGMLGSILPPIKRVLCPLWGTENGKLPLSKVKAELEDFKAFAESLNFEVVFFSRNGVSPELETADVIH